MRIILCNFTHNQISAMFSVFLPTPLWISSQWAHFCAPMHRYSHRFSISFFLHVYNSMWFYKCSNRRNIFLWSSLSPSQCPPEGPGAVPRLLRQAQAQQDLQLPHLHRPGRPLPWIRTLLWQTQVRAALLFVLLWCSLYLSFAILVSFSVFVSVQFNSQKKDYFDLYFVSPNFPELWVW